MKLMFGVPFVFFRTSRAVDVKTVRVARSLEFTSLRVHIRGHLLTCKDTTCLVFGFIGYNNNK